jgi:aspartate beta-hydroxylase
MLQITDQTAKEFLQQLDAFGASAAAPTGSLDRIAKGFLILAGQDSNLPESKYQRPNFFLPGLTAKPFWDAKQFSWTAQLDANFEAIREELNRLRDRPSFGLEPEADLVDTGVWAQFDFYIEGRKLETNCAMCPKTTAVLESIEEARDSDLMLFSAHAPGTHVRPHCGPHNARLRCHFGLLVPPGCRIRVGEEIRTWKEGACLVFDDSFEHEVWNDGDETRVVLLLDVWHPEVTAIEKMAIRAMANGLKAAVLSENEKEKLNRWEYVQDPTRERLNAEWWI